MGARTFCGFPRSFHQFQASLRCARAAILAAGCTACSLRQTLAKCAATAAHATDATLCQSKCFSHDGCRAKQLQKLSVARNTKLVPYHTIPYRTHPQNQPVRQSTSRKRQAGPIRRDPNVRARASAGAAQAAQLLELPHCSGSEAAIVAAQLDSSSRVRSAPGGRPGCRSGRSGPPRCSPR